MAKKSTKQVLFFVLMLVLFYLALRLANYWNKVSTKMNQHVAYIAVAIAYTAVMIGMYYMADLENTSEGFWDITPAAKFKGVNWYNCQGDSPEAKECRDMLESPEGQCAIAAYSCPTGYVGTPKIPFWYTPLSDDQWQNARCKDEQTCSCSPNVNSRGSPTAFQRTMPFDTCS